MNALNHTQTDMKMKLLGHLNIEEFQEYNMKYKGAKNNSKNFLITKNDEKNSGQNFTKLINGFDRIIWI